MFVWTCVHIHMPMHSPHISPSITKAVEASWRTTDVCGHTSADWQGQVFTSPVLRCVYHNIYVMFPCQQPMIIVMGIIVHTFKIIRSYHALSKQAGWPRPALPPILASQRTDVEIPPVVSVLHWPVLKETTQKNWVWSLDLYVFHLNVGCSVPTIGEPNQPVTCPSQTLACEYIACQHKLPKLVLQTLNSVTASFFAI